MAQTGQVTAFRSKLYAGWGIRPRLTLCGHTSPQPARAAQRTDTTDSTQQETPSHSQIQQIFPRYGSMAMLITSPAHLPVLTLSHAREPMESHVWPLHTVVQVTSQGHVTSVNHRPPLKSRCLQPHSTDPQPYSTSCRNTHGPSLREVLSQQEEEL